MKQFKRVMFHDTEEFPNFEEKLTLGSKIDMRNLVNFNVSCGNSESLHIDVVPFSIAYKVSVKKSTEELSLMTLKKDSNIEGKLTFCLRNDLTNLLNFSGSSGKFENLHFDGLLLQKVCNV